MSEPTDMTDLTDTADTADPTTRSDRSGGDSGPANRPRLVPIICWAVIGVAVVVLLRATGTGLRAQVEWWGLAVALGVVAPGVACVRACREAAAPLIEDIGLGAPVGCVAAFLGWYVGRVSPHGMPAWVWGPFVVLVLLAVPWSRRRVLARPATGWSTPTHLAMAAAVAVALVWMAVDFLSRFPANPAGHRYYPDSLFQAAVVGHLQHSTSMTYPLVAGEPLSYEWFGHAVIAHLLDHTGLHLFDTTVRLAPVSLLLGGLIAVACAAKSVAGKVVAAPIAIALMVALGTTTATWAPDGLSFPMVQTYWWDSFTTNFGWFVTVPAAALLIALMRGVRGAPYVLLPPLLFFSAGVKPSDLVVLLGGTGLALAGQLLLTRRVTKRTVAAVALTAAVLALSKLVIYSGSGSGLRLVPLAGFAERAARFFPGLAQRAHGGLYLNTPSVPAVTVVGALLVFFVPLLPRLTGLVLLRRSREDPGSWFMLGAFIAGALGLLLFRQPGQSESFFLISGYPIVLIGSAWGLAVAAPRLRESWRALVLGAALAAALCVAIAAVAPRRPLAALTTRFGRPPMSADMGAIAQVGYYLAPLGALALGIVVVIGVVLGVQYARTRRGPRDAGQRRALGALAVGLMLGTGLLSTGLYLTGSKDTLGHTIAQGGGVLVTAGEVRASSWLADHSKESDVIAVNRVCVQPTPVPRAATSCTAKAFEMSSLTGRELYVGAWAYASRNLDSAWSANGAYFNQAFWDPKRIKAEQHAFSRPTAAGLTALRRAGVRYLVSDRRGWHTDYATLNRLATRVLTADGVVVWRLKVHPGRV